MAVTPNPNNAYSILYYTAFFAALALYGKTCRMTVSVLLSPAKKRALVFHTHQRPEKTASICSVILSH